MSHIHTKKHLNQHDIVELGCDTQCNFMLLDTLNYQKYRSGMGYRYFGGHFTYFPAKIEVPHTGTWNVVIDLGGYSARIKYHLSYIT